MPGIATAPATPLLSGSGAQVGFAVTPNGVATTASVIYSTRPIVPGVSSYSQTTAQSIGSGKAAVNVTAFLSGLAPDTLYYYEVVTTSAAGTFYSNEESITTLGFDVTQVAATGQPPGDGLPTLASLGNAAVEFNDGAAFRATITGAATTSNTGIWANQNDTSDSGALTLVAQTGATAAGTGGAVFATLGDPVYNDNEDVAFGATLKVATGLVTTATENGVWATNAFALGLIAREGSVAPGAGAATFSTFGSVGLTDNAGAILLATLGGTGVTTANNEGVWEGATAGALTLMLRSGEMVTTDAPLNPVKTIAAFSFLPTETVVNGQTRGFGPSTGHLAATATYTDKSTGIVEVTTTPGAPTAVVTSGDGAAGTATATFATFSSPAINDSDGVAFAATLKVGVGDTTKTNAGGIWAGYGAGTPALIARLGQVAPGLTTSATFTAFSDPVDNDSGAVAFRATLGTGTGQATTATDTGIWFSSGGTLALVAQQGHPAPGCATGVDFLAFTELGLDDVNGGGVLFLATLSGTGVTTANNTGLFAVDNNGVLQLIVRTGDVIGAKTITALTFLPAETLVNGQTRSFSPSTGDLVYNATFSDKSQAIFNVVFP
jgi:hypothetical protein